MILTSCSCRHVGRFLSPSGVLTVDARRRRVDPTGLGSTRRRYEADMVGRFRALKRAVREAIVKLDVLGLKSPGNVNAQLLTRSFAHARVGDALAVPAQKQFAFERNAQKVTGFMEWLRQAEREGILEISHGTPMRMAADASWQNVYIDTAYKKAMRDSYGRMGQIVAGFHEPVHADAAAMIYTRAYESLSGINEVMSTQISRELAQGLLEGKGSMEIASDIEDRIESIGITRARTLARTEVTAAYAEATLNSYAEMGVEGVEVEAEFSTAGDDSVCPECDDLEGKIYPIEEARGLIPVHPNCRCAFIPVVPDTPVDNTQEGE